MVRVDLRGEIINSTQLKKKEEKKETKTTKLK